MKELFYLNKYFYKYKFYLLGGILFVALSNVFKVLSPKILGYAVDMVVENLNLFTLFQGATLKNELIKVLSHSILLFFLAYVSMALISGVFTFLMRQAIIVLSRIIEFDLKNEIYKHYQELDIAFYKRNSTGDLMNRATEDVSRVRMYLGPALMYMINVFFLFIFVIYSMVSIHLKLTLWVLLPLPILTVSIYYVNNIINKRSEQIQIQLSNLTTKAQEFFSGIRVLKSYVQEEEAIKIYDEASEVYKDKTLHLARVQALFFPLMILLVGLSTVIVVIAGAFYVEQGSITPGNLLEFIMYVNLLTWPVTSIGWAASLIQRAEASQKRINEFLKTKPEIDSNKGEIIDLKGNIDFKNLSFTYKDTGINALTGLNLSIKPGEKWAVMGKTGSGKTTFAELIAGLYFPTEGKLELEGIDIKDIKLRDLRNQLAYIPQDVFLFSDTIYNNIKFGNSNITDAEAEEAARKASIYHEIKEFPQGFNTIVGERGVTLSGGQKQRISIARALALNPKLLLVDDALSAVDVQTEHEIIANLKESINDKTVILISHRVFESLEFDQIIILDNGKIAEQGTHSELLARKGIYFEFYTKQNEVKQTTVS